MDGQNRSLAIRLEGRNIGHGRAPFVLLQRVIGGLQDALIIVAIYELEQRGRTRGKLPDRVREACRLDLVATAEGSFGATLALPDVGQQALGLDGEIELGERSLARLGDVMALIGAGDTDGALAQVLPDGVRRTQVLRRLRDVAPAPADGYLAHISIAGKGALLDSRFRERATRLFEEPKEALRILVGRVIAIQISPTRYFDVFVGNVRVRCHFSEESDSLIGPTVGKVVEVRGRAELTARGDLKRLISVEDFEVLDEAMLVLQDIQGKSRSFRLATPLEFSLSYDDGVLVAENEPLGLVVTGVSRESLLRELQLDFEALWEEYALEDDANLTPGAQVLKDMLRKLVNSGGDETPDADLEGSRN